MVVKGDIKVKELGTYEKEYVTALNALGIDYKRMVDVPVVDADGKSFRYCLHNLNDIVGVNNF